METALSESVHGFAQYLVDHRNLFIRAETILENMTHIKFIVAKTNKLYTFDENSKAYAIAGKVASVYKRSKKTIEETGEERDSRE